MKTLIANLFFAFAAFGQTVSIGPAIFSGSGPNDAASGGRFTGAAANAQYVVTITATGKPDRFRWSRNGGSPSPAVAISGEEQALADGVTIKFAATTGHTLNDLWSILVTSNGSSPNQTFLQSGNGAKGRDIQDKLRDIVSVKDYGAVCDRVTDDRVAIQAAINATAGGTLYLPGTACAVSSPGVFLYPANSGMTLVGKSSVTNFGGGGGGLIAYTPSPPAVILTQYAQNAKLQNILFDCNARAATNGIVNVMGLAAVWEHVTTQDCAGDGAVGNQWLTPVVAITGGGGIGSSVVTVASGTNNRLTFGTQTCGIVAFDYGTANYELLSIRPLPGATLTLYRTLTHAHTNVRCAGNLDFFHVSHYAAFRNGGWGWRIVSGSDNNAIWWENALMSGNALGGELWCGAENKHYGGDYQGDGGYAIQLGDTTGCLTAFMTVGPPGDLEENSAAFNTVAAVCDDDSHIEFTLPEFLTITTGTAACPLYRAGGSTTTGMGTGADRQFIVKNSGGTIESRPGSNGAIYFYDPTHTLLNTLSISDIKGLGAGKPITDFAHAQLEANGGQASLGQCHDCKLMMGYRTDTKEGFIQAVVFGSNSSLLTLNPTGGAVRLGATVTVSKLPPSCEEGDRRFATNAASTTFNDIAVDAGARGNHVPVFCDGSKVWRIG